MDKILRDKIFEKAKAKGFKECEVYYTKGDSFSVNIFKGEIYQYKNSSTQGLGFRGLYNNKMSYAFSEEISEDMIDSLLENALVNNEIIEINEDEELFDGNGKYDEFKSYYTELNKYSVENKIEIAKKMEKAAYDVDDRVKSVNSSVVGSSESYTYISNTLGLEKEEKSNIGYAYVYVEIDDETPKVAIETWLGNNFDELDYNKLAKIAVEKGIKQINASPVKSISSTNVIFENESFMELLSAFIPSFYGDNVQKGFSKLKGKLNEKIASEKITINDNNYVESWYSNSSFDCEGYPTKNKKVVDKGELKTFLYNLKTAKKEGIESTGNGFKGSFKSSVSTSHCNFYIENGNISIEDLIAKEEYGFYINDLAGIHSGVNTISGDFSLSAKGFLLENGKISKPIEDITVAGNFFDMLFNCEDIANDLKFDFPSGLGSIGSPSICFSDLSIGGM